MAGDKEPWFTGDGTREDPYLRTGHTEVQTTAPITITLDIATLAKHLVPDYDSPYSEDGPEPMGALDGILKHVAALLVKDIRKEYVKATAETATEEVRATVASIVASVMEEGASIGTGYSKTELRPIRELIFDEVQAFVTKQAINGNRRETAMQEMVRTEVAKALKADLSTVLEEQRVIFKAAVQAAAAQQIADAAARRV
jgi:hypothetical protein